MKHIALALILSISTIAAATPTKLLDCSTPIGPDQGIIVNQDGGKLLLIEDTIQGGSVTRELSAQEWNSGVLNLREDFGYKTTLTLDKHGGGYLHATNGGSYNEFGPADCQ